MNDAITVELQFFLISILWGAIILIVYDILRIFRRLIPHNSFFIALEDLIFWVLASVFIFAMIYTMNNGTIRGFSVMGMGIGMTLYHYILSEMFVKWILKALLLLLLPMRLFLEQIKRVLFFVTSKVKRAARYMNKRLKKLSTSVKIALSSHKRKRFEKRRLRKAAAKEKAEKRNSEKEEKQSNLRKAAKHRKNKSSIDRVRQEPAELDKYHGYKTGSRAMDGYGNHRVHKSGSIPVRNARGKNS